MPNPILIAHERRKRGLAKDPLWLTVWLALHSVYSVILHNFVVLYRALREEAYFQAGKCPHCPVSVPRWRRYELRTNRLVHKMSCYWISAPSQWRNFIWR